MVCPSGLNTALKTWLVWPARVASGTPRASHNRAVWSSEAVRMVWPSGLNTALTTTSVWPASGVGLQGTPSIPSRRVCPVTGLASRAWAS